MKRIFISLPVVVLLLGIWGVSHAVTIDSIDFKGCISETCQTPISIVATDPAGGNLSYDWEVLNGPSALIVGSGPDVVFDPPDTGPHPCPYQIKVAVTSDASGLTAYETIDICVKLAGDVNGDGTVGSTDLREIRDHFGETGDPGWIAADVNCDGVVDARDLRIIRNTFGQTSTCSDSYFFDNFECGLGKWRVSGTDWGLTPSAFQGGTWSFTDSPGGDYADNANATATMRYSIDLSSSTQPVLAFWHKAYLAYADYMYVEISVDGGFTWTTLYSTGSNHYTSTFSQKIIDLSGYKEPNVTIRFRLRETNAYVSDGWYIDNVEIRELADEPEMAFPFFDDFESGTDNWLLSGLDWEIIPVATLEGNYAITESAEGNYPDNANSTLTIKGHFDLSSSTHPVLTFWHKAYLAYADYMYVQISIDGGFTWTNIYFAGSDSYTSTFSQKIIDLSGYKEPNVKIRFKLRETNAYVSDGLYIDNVEIRELADEPEMAFPFFDDFESGTDNWLLSGLDWEIIPMATLEGNYAITESAEGNYPDNANSTLTIKGHFDLSSSTHPVLTFWHKAYLAYADYMYVQISIDGGFTWTNIHDAGSDYYTSTFSRKTIDLNGYSEPNVKIRFKLRETNAYVSDGWYIDNVEIRELTDEPGMAYPFFDDFESGTDDWLLSGMDWGLTDSASVSGSYCITDSPSGNYPDNTNAVLYAKCIDLTTASSPVLRFWHKYSLAYADYIFVDVSTDRGITWGNIYTIGSDVYQSTFTPEQLDLSPYIGAVACIRFRLREANAYVSDGWYIDDVEISELEPE